MKKTYSIFILLIVNLLFSQNNSPEIIVSNKVKEVRILNANNEVVSVSKYDNNGRLIFTSADNFTYSIFWRFERIWYWLGRKLCLASFRKQQEAS